MGNITNQQKSKMRHGGIQCGQLLLCFMAAPKQKLQKIVSGLCMTCWEEYTNQQGPGPGPVSKVIMKNRWVDFSSSEKEKEGT